MSGKILTVFWVAVFILSSSLVSYAADKDERSFDGYSYLAIGYAKTNYKEKSSLKINGKNVETDVTVSSPIYYSGGLFKVTDKYDFSIDAKSTLVANSSEETWSAGVNLQENEFDATLNDIQILAHYKFTNKHRLVLGGGFSLNTFKRYDYQALVTGINAPIGVVEERVADLAVRAGYVFESATAAYRGFRYRFNAIASKPIWIQASNTYITEKQFDDTDGYAFEIGGYAGYALINGAELGVFASYSYQKLDGGKDVSNGIVTEWPENELQTTSIGLQFNWKF